MPHFLAYKTNFCLPLVCNDYEISYKIQSLKYPELSLFCVRYQQRVFFIQERKRKDKNDILIKALKITKPAPVGILKEALKILSRHSDTFCHNLENTKPKQEVEIPYFINPEDLHKLKMLDSTRSISLEIGFGSGRHILWLAKQNPQSLFIGLEVHTPSIEQVLRQIQILGLENLYILNFDARILLEILPSNILHRIYLHFPVPWNKAKHRRIMSKTFLAHALRVLHKDGILELRTDDKEYFTDTLESILSFPNAKFMVHKNISQEITSKYEARWQKQQKDIYDVNIISLHDEEQNIQDFSFTQDFDFMLPKALIQKILSNPLSQAKIDNLTQKRVYQGYFLHIYDVYQDLSRVIFLVSIGDFLLPLNRVIVLQNDNSVLYYPQSFIPNQGTIMAYIKFIEVLENL